MKLTKFLSVLSRLVFSEWIKKDFKTIGKNGSFASPINIHGPKYISIGDNFCCDQRFRLDAIDSFLDQVFLPKITIGDNVSIQKDCHIGAINEIVIGNNVLIASKVFITDHSHGQINQESIKIAPISRNLYSKGPVILEDNVWIGEGVAIMPGVTIGKNSIVGANAVVTKTMPKNVVIGGNPARIIKHFYKQ